MEYLVSLSSGDLLVSGALFVFTVLILTSVYFNLKRAISGVRMSGSTKTTWRLNKKKRSRHLDRNSALIYPNSDQVVGGARKVQPSEQYVHEPTFESIEDIHENGVVAQQEQPDFSEPNLDSTVEFTASSDDSALRESEELDEVEWNHTTLADDTVHEPEPNNAYQSLEIFSADYEYEKSEKTTEEWEEHSAVEDYESVEESDELTYADSNIEYQEGVTEVEDQFTTVNNVGQESYSATPEQTTSVLNEEFDTQTIDAQVAEPSQELAFVEDEPSNLSKDFVVSVCLLYVYKGKFYQNVRGEKLNEFLRKRRFVLLDNEFHHQVNSMVDAGGIRVRNYYKQSINELINGHSTVGIRMYFLPHQCKNPLSTLDSMLQIANLAVQYFDNRLVVYDGMLSPEGNLRQLTRQRYESIKNKLSMDFPQDMHRPARNLRERMSEPSLYLPEDQLHQATA